MKSKSKSKTSNNNDATSAHQMKKSTANTIFFRYSPSISSITRKDFETYFSDIGPVKKCSLIRTSRNRAAAKEDFNATTDASGSTGREAKGYGFCKFTCQQDAVDAVRQFNESKMTKEDGSNIKVWVELADTTTTSSGSAGDNNKEPADTTPATTPLSKKKTRVDQTPSSHLPEGTPTKNDAAASTEDLMELQAKKRTCRVIIRNLSFYATEYNIRQIMEEKFGSVVDIHLPLVPQVDSNENNESNDNKKRRKKHQQHRGFAFVTFANQKSAAKAVDACNNDDNGGVIIKKRPVAIDFSVSKMQHRRMAEEEKNADNEEDEDDEDDADVNKSSSDEESDDNDDSATSEEEVGDESDDSSDSDVEMEGTKSSEVDKSSYTSSLFLRNLPFDTTRHDVFTLFAKFGRIDGIYLVKDKNTGLAKGTAFVRYVNDVGCKRALEAGTMHHQQSNTDEFESGKDIMASMNHTSSGLFLRGRRILVDKAVDRNTAESLKVQRDEDGKPIDNKIGKDKRNLYLKGEGRVEESKSSGKDSSVVDGNSWENIPESDQMKRGRAHQEKSTKLRSPLFFINPYRLSLRNLAKHVDETQLKTLMATGIKNGLEKELVSKEDVVAHWRAGGEMTAREIIEKLKASEESGNDAEIIPPYNESDGHKKYIPSVFIDRDFEVKDGKVSKHTAPSRGFGFAEFTHHAHALACLRELNNNTSYTKDYVAGGKKAVTMKKQMSSRKKQKKAKLNNATTDMDESFVGEDGRVRIPRLIVEFTVENKAKARKQAERKAQQLENALKQKAAAKQRSSEESGEKKKKKKSRGAQQRAKKRKMKEEGISENKDDGIGKKPKTSQKHDQTEGKDDTKVKKTVKPTKKKKLDKDESAFENMVRTYKKAFTEGDKATAASKLVNERAEITKKRWFD